MLSGACWELRYAASRAKADVPMAPAAASLALLMQEDDLTFSATRPAPLHYLTHLPGDAGVGIDGDAWKPLSDALDGIDAVTCMIPLAPLVRAPAFVAGTAGGDLVLLLAGPAGPCGALVRLFDGVPVVSLVVGPGSFGSGSPPTLHAADNILWVLCGGDRLVSLRVQDLELVADGLLSGAGTPAALPRVVLPFRTWSAPSHVGLTMAAATPSSAPSPYWDVVVTGGELVEDEMALILAGRTPILCLFTSPFTPTPATSLAHLAADVAGSLKAAVTFAGRHVGRQVIGLLPAAMGAAVKDAGKGLFSGSWLRSSSSPDEAEAPMTENELLANISATHPDDWPARLPRWQTASAATRARAPTAMTCEFEFDDAGKSVAHIAISPCGRLALAADSQGRVALLDTGDLAVLRLWKGYREAEVGWVYDAASVESHPAIYSARRRAVEIFQGRHGPRVIKLVVPPGSRLVQLHRRGSSDACTGFAGHAALSVPSGSEGPVVATITRLGLEKDTGLLYPIEHNPIDAELHLEKDCISWRLVVAPPGKRTSTSPLPLRPAAAAVVFDLRPLAPIISLGGCL